MFIKKIFDKVFVMAHKNLLKITNPKEVFGDNSLLDESMLKRPYISELVEQLELPKSIISRKELVDYVHASV